MYDILKLVKPNGGLDCHSSNLELSNVMAAQRGRCSVGSENVTLSVKADIYFPAEHRDFGWYVSTDGGAAKHGSCLMRAMTRPAFNNAVVQDQRTGDVVGQVEWLADPFRGVDECGDIVMKSGGGGILHNVLLFGNLEVPCVDTNDDTNLDIGICFTWHEKNNDDFCNKDLLYPGAPTLCHCERLEINEVTVEPALATESMKE
jgi:hypothetical protein